MNNFIGQELNINNNIEIEEKQKSFLETTLGKTINTGIDIGIRTILPDYIEDQIIDLKNNLINYGLKDGIKKSIDDAINLGKSAIGIITGNFENISQVQNAVKSDNISSLLDNVIDRVETKGVINYTVAKTIKQGKNSILNNVEKNINETFNNQIKALSYTEKYIDNWKKYYNDKNFDGMEKEYKKIEKEYKNLIPIENTINDIRKIENLHNLIKNNGQNFELTQDEKELIEKL